MRRLALRTGMTVLGITALALTGCATATHSGSSPSGIFSHPDGSPVLGTFEVKGGPSGVPATRPLSGVVTFRDKAGHTTNLTAGRNGQFSDYLPAGTYTVTARSEQIRQQNPDGSYSDPPCTGPVTVLVQPTQTTHVTLTCIVP
jgi:hypothetical protein